ncbi:hypothetical protein BGZ61DRAFT_36499 [Ilyonectria robusta]|uniref:uncharacterized protein n=1 Tax=Ilyonectria robusta TaxID=1079257 RepID=UPI001E8E3FBA|nr:uncharacterized protein BGZ61DRAFT_36499 [Ilyonectria robusta]KAH8694811.1 hypothetical protein BGZ61DRAFT_36499 [Ilyonectria robusta]
MAREAFHPRPCETHAESHELVSKPPNHRAAITHPPLHHPSFGHGRNTSPSMLPQFPQPVHPCRPGRPWPKLGLAANPSSNPPSLTPFPRAPELDPLRLSNGVSLSMAKVWSPLLLSRRNPRLVAVARGTLTGVWSVPSMAYARAMSRSRSRRRLSECLPFSAPRSLPPTLPARPKQLPKLGSLDKYKATAPDPHLRRFPSPSLPLTLFSHLHPQPSQSPWESRCSLQFTCCCRLDPFAACAFSSTLQKVCSFSASPLRATV